MYIIFIQNIIRVLDPSPTDNIEIYIYGWEIAREKGWYRVCGSIWKKFSVIMCCATHIYIYIGILQLNVRGWTTKA